MKKKVTQKLNYKGHYSRIGLDIGSSQIKFVQLKGERGRVKVHQYGICALPEGIIEGGRVIDSETLTSRLQWLLGRRRLHKKKINLCIGGQCVILRQIFLPPMSSRELADAIYWEAEKQIMIPLNQVVMDYASLGIREVGGKQATEVVLVAVPREVVEQYIDVVTGAGFYPDAIEIEPFALRRSVYHLQQLVFPKELQNVIVLDMGGESSNLLVMEEGRYSFSRTLSVGVNHFCRRIMESGQKTAEEAQKLVFGSDIFAVPGILEVAEELYTQIKHSMEYFVYEMKHQEKDFERMFFCGGGYSIKELWSFLGGELKIEPVPFNPLAAISKGRQSHHLALQRDGNLLVVAQGLALRGWIS